MLTTVMPFDPTDTLSITSTGFQLSNLPASFIDATAQSGVGRENLLSLWATATQEQVADGVRWYHLAHDICQTIADHYGISDPRWVAFAMAATSPQTSWPMNVRIVCILARNYQRSLDALTNNQTIRSFTAKGWDCLHGQTDCLTGSKVCAFADNIANPSTSDRATIDIHMLSAWSGIRLNHGRSQISEKKTDPHGRYNRIAADIRWCARFVGLSTCEFQAVIWNVWRETILGHDPYRDIDVQQIIFDVDNLPVQ